MDGLRRRPIGSSGVSVTELGFGSAALGNLYAPVADTDAEATIAAAWAGGVRYFDVAPFYGFGLAERRLGRALAGGVRAGVVVSTKAGRVLEPDASVTDDRERHGFRSAEPFSPRFDYSRNGILRSYEESVARLSPTPIDLLLLHDVGARTHGAEHPRHLAALRDDGFAALAELREGGAVRAVGVGVNDVDAALEMLDMTTLDVVLIAGRYTLLDQSGFDRLLPRCAALGVAVVVGGPFNSGALVATDGVQRYDYQAAHPDITERVSLLRAVAHDHGVSLPAAALQFPLAHPAVVSVIPGLANAHQVKQALSFYHERVPAEFWTELVSRRLLREDAPLPMPVPA